jgi:hypothetical protein
MLPEPCGRHAMWFNDHVRTIHYLKAGLVSRELLEIVIGLIWANPRRVAI